MCQTISCGENVKPSTKKFSSPKFAEMSVPIQTLQGCSVEPDPSCRDGLMGVPSVPIVVEPVPSHEN